MKKLLILGAGGYGRVIADLAAQLGTWRKIAFLDDRAEGPGILGTCGDYAAFCDGQTQIYPAFGNNAVRMDWLSRLLAEGRSVPTLIHPRAYVSPQATLGTGCVVLPVAVVNTGAVLEPGCIVNIGALIDHDCILEAGCHIAPGAVVKAENRIPAGEKVESGQVIFNRTYPL